MFAAKPKTRYALKISTQHYLRIDAARLAGVPHPMPIAPQQHSEADNQDDYADTDDASGNRHCKQERGVQ